MMKRKIKTQEGFTKLPVLIISAIALILILGIAMSIVLYKREKLQQEEIAQGDLLPAEKVEPSNNEISAFLDHLGLKTYHIQRVDIVDINENGEEEFIVQAIGKECGSCHFRPLFIIEGGEVIFKYDGDDAIITNIANNELSLKEPIRLDDEPYCCPSSFKTTIIYCPQFVGISYCYIKKTYPNTPQE